MKPVVVVVQLLASLALLPLALDWRSPLLSEFRPLALVGLTVVPLGLILGQAWTLRASRADQRGLRALSWLGLLAATLTLTATLALEGHFRWDRHEVLRADPIRLEMVGRHVIVGYRDLAEIRDLVRLRGVAGVFLSGRNVRGKSAAEVKAEVQSLQDERRKQGLAPLWIATDQEGGSVSRLSPPLPRLPPLSKLVEGHTDAAGLQSAVRQFAGTQGGQLAELGVNLNFAPVVDINHKIVNPNDHFTRIFERAISGDPAVVTEVAGWYCAALEEAGVRCTLKHFPGLGKVFEDTHLSQATLGTSVSELTESDWAPFRTLMRNSGAFVMLGHVRLTVMDPERPASFSAAVIGCLLRGDWKYDGVLITDDFSMRAVYYSNSGIDKGSIDALNAGVDLILISWDSDQYYRMMYSLLEADRNGRLDRRALLRSDERLARAVQSLRR